MQQRALVVFPQANEFDVVERMRRRYDPQARLIAAHVTIVFPFDDDLSDAELRKLVMEATTGLAPFTVRFSGISAVDDYIFLEPTQGLDRLVALNNRLYTGPLLRHRSRTQAYRPHVTLARIPDATTRDEAVDLMRGAITDFDAEVTAVCVFRLTAPEQGSIDATIPLRR
jgi:2'-5' RNA ligase